VQKVNVAAIPEKNRRFPVRRIENFQKNREFFSRWRKIFETLYAKWRNYIKI
jgi:hypothetical protein